MSLLSFLLNRMWPSEADQLQTQQSKLQIQEMQRQQQQQQQQMALAQQLGPQLSGMMGSGVSGLSTGLGMQRGLGGGSNTNIGSGLGGNFTDRIRQAESGGNMNAVGALGERSDMQVMPTTSRDPGFGVKPAASNDPTELSRVGRDYAGAMLGRYGDEGLAAGAYNAGPGAMDKALAAAGGDRQAAIGRLPSSTQSYIQKVMGSQGAGKQASGAGQQAMGGGSSAGNATEIQRRMLNNQNVINSMAQKMLSSGNPEFIKMGMGILNSGMDRVNSVVSGQQGQEMTPYQSASLSQRQAESQAEQDYRGKVLGLQEQKAGQQSPQEWTAQRKQYLIGEMLNQRWDDTKQKEWDMLAETSQREIIARQMREGKETSGDIAASTLYGVNPLDIEDARSMGSKAPTQQPPQAAGMAAPPVGATPQTQTQAPSTQPQESDGLAQKIGRALGMGPGSTRAPRIGATPTAPSQQQQRTPNIAPPSGTQAGMSAPDRGESIGSTIQVNGQFYRVIGRTSDGNLKLQAIAIGGG